MQQADTGGSFGMDDGEDDEEGEDNMWNSWHRYLFLSPTLDIVILSRVIVSYYEQLYMEPLHGGIISSYKIG